MELLTNQNLILVTDMRMCKHVVVSLAVKRWTEGCYNVTMPLKASKDTKCKEKQRTNLVLRTSWKLTPMYFARVVFLLLFFFLSSSSFYSAVLCFALLLLRLLYFLSTFIQYMVKVIPHFINNAASCFCIVQPMWFSADCFRGEWKEKGKEKAMQENSKI